VTDDLSHLAYAARTAPARGWVEPPPAYTAIRLGGSVLVAAGAVYIITGLVCFGVAAYMIVTANPAERNPDPNSLDPSAWVVGGGMVLAGLVAVAWGLMVAMLGSLALAVRDMARNSFRR
jgi:hypothetical protein